MGSTKLHYIETEERKNRISLVNEKIIDTYKKKNWAMAVCCAKSPLQASRKRGTMRGRDEAQAKKRDELQKK